MTISPGVPNRSNPYHSSEIAVMRVGCGMEWFPYCDGELSIDIVGVDLVEDRLCSLRQSLAMRF